MANTSKLIYSGIKNQVGREASLIRLLRRYIYIIFLFAILVNISLSLSQPSLALLDFGINHFAHSSIR